MPERNVYLTSLQFDVLLWFPAFCLLGSILSNSSPVMDYQSQGLPQKGACTQGYKFRGPELAVPEVLQAWAAELLAEFSSVTSMWVHIHVQGGRPADGKGILMCACMSINIGFCGHLGESVGSCVFRVHMCLKL